MTKTFCDCCGKEIHGRSFNFKYFVHIDTENRRILEGHVQVIDGKDHSVSGREEGKELCLPCYNEILPAAFGKFLAMKFANLQPVTQ